MPKQEMKSGVSYRVVVERDGEYIGSAVARRVGEKHVETNTSVVDAKYHSEIADALKQVTGAFDFMAHRPRLGELVQRAIWEMLNEEENDGDDFDVDQPPF